MPAARSVENFSFDRDSGEWDYVVPGYNAENFSRVDRQHLQAVHDGWSLWAGRCDFDLIVGQLRSRGLSILALPKPRKIRGAGVVIRHWRARWVQQPEQAPRRLDYRDDSAAWIRAMRGSLEKNRHLSVAEAYRFAVRKLGEPQGAGRPESKQARIIRRYRIRYGSHKRP